ncbi:centromere protein I-like isoform X2 [Leptidea sinapis]|uniref:centromere protein I-like isoform X2 n=1 Tax=Leptidea sinapis TaxID=189913 RepID=UPI0021C4C26D|nr:centromere protein I-like isoform X2 [Leptidea sinapis]
MSDVSEILHYMKSLRKGFDKSLFESKIEELCDVVMIAGLNSDDFHSLFTVWLNLSIPIKNWTSLGLCIVPQEIVGQKSVEYALRWLLEINKSCNDFPKIAFLLDWLTAAMDSDSVDMKALDMGYEVFYALLANEELSIHALKLIYTLTKPIDVTRKRVLEILNYIKIREQRMNLCRPLQVLLGLFKSYKPQCVPEAVPYRSIHTAFRKINVLLITRFQTCQNRRNTRRVDKQKLVWVEPLNMGNKKGNANPLIPELDFIYLSSYQYSDKVPEKNYFDFSDPVSLLQYSLHHNLSRPARMRAVFANSAGRAQLLLAPAHIHNFFLHDLHHVLFNAFLDVSPHSMEEKKQFLELLAIFQSTVMQGLSVITTFLAKFLPHWNEKDYFMQILALIEWLHVESHDQVRVILDTLTKVYCRAHPIQQCAILNSVTKAYTNLVYASTRKRHFFLNVQPPENSYTEMIELVAYKINEICSKGLQTNPEDMRVMLGSVSSLRRCVRMELLVCGPVVSTPALLTVALPLISTSALAIDMIADLLLMYKKIFSAIKAKYGRRDEKDIDKMKMLKAFTSDIVSCFQEQFITNRSEGIIFSNIQPNIIKKLTYLVPDADSKLSFRNHVAFAPYTSMRHEQMIDDIDHKSLFDAKIAQAFVHLGRFVELSMPTFRK